MKYNNKFFGFLRFILYPWGRLLFPCKVMNKHKYKKYDRGQVLISNHLAWLDVCYVFFGLPGGEVRPLSKKENSGGKLQRKFLESVGVIFIDRDKPELSTMRTCLNALKNGSFNRSTRARLCSHSKARRAWCRMWSTIKAKCFGAIIWAWAIPSI